MRTRRGTQAEPKIGAGVSDDTVRKKTGKGWRQWFAILDRAGSRSRPHKDIAAWLRAHNEVGAWYAQQITVAYEQARGMRAAHQERDGGFAVNASKTIAAPLEKVFRAWKTRTARRRWLEHPSFEVRKLTENKSMRITWIDGRTHVDANFQARSPEKSVVSVQHRKLSGQRDVASKRKYWRASLERLKEVLEG